MLAVKPPIVETVIRDISEYVTPKHLMISIAAGITLESMENLLPKKTRVVRVMSNTPVLIREGATVFALGTHATKQDGDVVKKLFESVGVCEQVAENLIDAVTALSGSGPAYVSFISLFRIIFLRYRFKAYMMMEALADSGVLQGLPRDVSYNLVAHTLIGAAKMVLETGKHPASLKVCLFILNIKTIDNL